MKLLAASSAPSTSASDHHRHHRILLTSPSTLSYSFRSNTSTARLRLCICSAKKRPWDSNAESFRQRSYGVEIDDDEDKDWIDQGSGFVDKAIDNIFIFKVLKSYGWMLPFIIISMLIVSGPKAFLYTLGIFIGLSLIAYGFQSLRERSPVRKSKRKKKSPTTADRSNAYVGSDRFKRARRKESTASWATRYDDSAGKGVQGKTFGGWDELDEAIGYNESPIMESGKVDSKEPDESIPEPVKMREQTRVRAELNRLNRRRREMSRTPLLLRLLVATFPFLNSWIKLL